MGTANRKRKIILNRAPQDVDVLAVLDLWSSRFRPLSRYGRPRRLAEAWFQTQTKENILLVQWRLLRIFSDNAHFIQYISRYLQKTLFDNNTWKSYIFYTSGIKRSKNLLSIVLYDISSTLTAIIFLHNRVATKMALEILRNTICRVRLWWLVSLPHEVSKLVYAWLEGVELFF